MLFQNWINVVGKNQLCRQFRILRNTPLKIMFFGTDEFSLSSLQLLTHELKNGSLIRQLNVVTSMSSHANPVLTFARNEALPVLGWPLSTSNIKGFDLGLVVSFGHLIPERIIDSFPFGMLNVHASMLPRWRGAAPIIYSILSGDTYTGVSIMKIRPKHFDIGEVISQKSVSIGAHTLMPELRTTLAEEGAMLLLNALNNFPECLDRATLQNENLCTYAPRVNSSIAGVKWNEMTSKQVYDLHRAVVGLYSLTTCWHGTAVKLFGCMLQQCPSPSVHEDTSSHNYCDSTIHKNSLSNKSNSKIYHGDISKCSVLPCKEVETKDKKPSQNATYLKPGFIVYDKINKVIRVFCKDSRYVTFNSIGVANRRPMSAADFNNGFLNKKPNREHYFS